MAGMSDVMDKSQPTILKDNISWHFAYPGANTTPWQLEAAIVGLRKAGFDDLVCVQNKTVVTNAYKGERLNRYLSVFNKHDIEVRYNFKPEDMKWIKYQPKGELLVLNKIFPDGFLIPDFFMGKNIIHLPTVKTHIYTTTTGAMKNAFGGLLNTRRHYTHSVIHETLVDLLMIQQEIHSGIFATMDGTYCGSGPGPRTMIPVKKDIILASADSVAIDAVAAKIMGFDPMDLPYIRLAHERGLGCGQLDDIEVLGEDISDWNFNFKVGDNLASTGGDLFWFGPLKKLQHLMFHTPLVYLFIWASFLYHDYFWYPFKSKKYVEPFLESPWGELFQNY
ncbi:iron-sulfur cluster-binding protein [candidate division LCP-89 bacterium B3_LCP]|uniref:Iron-sulfur cluster-binding protein n=1 Tax=candidate division LCP-89 bacterium B3_LCP TaxID=2012998 RepID=A0A532V3V1_UNCL8|nr:MAG: iron-sulfur cluster-binding protein [candidate division LCP-89 bacterium B3_LCP]